MTIEEAVREVLERYGSVPAPVGNAVTKMDDDGLDLAARDLATRIERYGLEMFTDGKNYGFGLDIKIDALAAFTGDTLRDGEKT